MAQVGVTEARLAEEQLPEWVREVIRTAPEELVGVCYGEYPDVELPREDTFPKLLARMAEARGSYTALREKEHGIWRRITWRELLTHVRNLALGLRALGFKQGDKITLIGDNRPEWMYTFLGAEAAGGIPFGVYQDNLAEQLLPLIRNSDSTWIYCEDQEQTDKVLSILDELPQVEKIIVEDWTGMWRYRDNPKLISLREIEDMGAKMAEREPGLFSDMISRQSKDDVACFVTSSGTTGVPKCVILTYENLLFMGSAMRKIVPMGPRDDYFSFLPFAWIGEIMMVFSCGLTAGFRINFYEEPETVWRDFREIGPTIMFGPPRIWRDIVSQIQVKIADSGRLRRALFEKALQLAYKRVDMEFRREPAPTFLKLSNWLAYWLIFRPILDKVGLKRIRHAYTGGAQVSVDDFKFLRAIGVNIKQIYGQTEISGISCLHRDGDVDPWTAGKPLPGTVIAITRNGEIISKSRAVMRGYYDRPDSQDVRNGWLYSADSGMVDSKGHLVVVDRMSDIIVLQDGTRVPPQHIENRLKFSPYIREACILDHGRPYVTAILNIHPENVGKWAEDNNIPYTGYVDLSQKPQVYELLADVVRRVNRDLPAGMRIRKFTILYKEFHPDDDEITRTRKLRRGLIRERYKPVIDALYSDAGEVSFLGEVRYEDGRRDTINVTMKIVQVE